MSRMAQQLAQSLFSEFRQYLTQWVTVWERFWFTPADTRLLSLLRLATGGMLFYTHLVWSLNLDTFANPAGLVPEEAIRNQPGFSPFHWSHLLSPAMDPTTLWVLHVLALAVFAMFAAGLFTRVTAVLSFLLAVSYANRLSLALFGLDQLNCMLAMYLMLGPCGAHYSLDSWWKRRASRSREQGRAGHAPLKPAPSIAANVAVRLIQCHMCVIYLFAGLSKLRGQRWVGGDAIWGAFASYEYQTLDMTWMAHGFWMINALTLGTIVWEISYAALIWPRLTRPWLLAGAVGIHLGIGLCMGMMTFGVIMLVGNAAFLNTAFQPGGLLDRLSQPRQNKDA